MDEELKALTDRWILTFCEAPPILDAKLMRQTLDELAPRPNDTAPVSSGPGEGRL